MRRLPKTYDLEFEPLARMSFRATRRFVNDADDLITKWSGIERLDQAMRDESPNAWFKRNAYRFLKRYVDAGQTAVFDDAIRRPPRQSSRRIPRRHLVGVDAIRDNPFKLGLFAMFSDDSLSRSDRHIFGNQMLYAHQHDVPPEHLIAFIRAAGSPPRIADKLRSGAREPSTNFG